MLNDAKIRAAKPRDKTYKLTDSHRLYLLVKPGGSKLRKWSDAYDGKQKTMHLGIYPWSACSICSTSPAWMPPMWPRRRVPIPGDE